MWLATDPDPLVTVAHGVPHAVVSRVLHKGVAAWVPPASIAVRTPSDVHNFVTALQVCRGGPIDISAAQQFVELTDLDFTDYTAKDEVSVRDVARHFPRLTALNLGRDIDPSALEHVGSLRGLQCLAVQHMHCVDADAGYFQPMARLPSLHTLAFEWCRVSSQALEVLSGLESLSSLDLRLCRDGIDAAAFSALSNLRGLRVLLLDACYSLTAAGLALLAHLDLRTLSVGSCPVDAACLQVIARMRSLEALSLDRCDAFDAEAGLRHVSCLPRLRELDLGCCSTVTSESLAHLANHRRLQHLELSCCPKVGALGYSHLSTISSLQSLTLRSSCGADARGLSELADLPNLTTLRVTSCPTIDGQCLQYIGRMLLLRTLELTCCSNVNAGGLSFLSQLPSLRCLLLRSCSGVDAGGLGHVARIDMLEELDVSGCYQVDTACVAQISRLRHLHALDLSECLRVDDETLGAIARLENLHALSLQDCSLVTESGIVSLSKLKKLYTVRLSKGLRNELADRVVSTSGVKVHPARWLM